MLILLTGFEPFKGHLKRKAGRGIELPSRYFLVTLLSRPLQVRCNVLNLNQIPLGAGDGNVD